MLVLLLAPAVQARPHPIQFVRHNKVRLIIIGSFLAASIADTKTTIDAQRRCPTCVETGDAYGPHPSSQRLWVEGRAFDAAYVALAWYGTKDTGLMGTKDFTPEEKAKHPTLYKLCWLEKPATVVAFAYFSEAHARAAYNNAQIPVTKH